MKAEDLKLSEIVTFEEGNLNLYGRRLVLHSMHAVAKTRKDIIDVLGLELARKVITRFGYFWGQADAAAMKRILKWHDTAELLRAGCRLHALQGVTPVNIETLEYEPETGRLLMTVNWSDSIEAEEHLTEIGWAKDPICWKLAGYASGYATFCLNKPVYFIEEKCRARGDDMCTAVGKDIDSWGDEIQPHLPYFEVDDIKDEIRELTMQLRNKTMELEKQREQLAQFHSRVSPYFMNFRSKKLQQIFELAGRIAGFDTSVIISGETGVGKEVLARYIHENSHRSDGAFMAISCAALPESLLESELFGHKAGAFTGAVKDRVGMFEKANGGTVFLDEIGDISAATQLKLLRVLQEGEITRLGESESRKIDVRVISPRRVISPSCVAAGTFREDLLYRLKVIELEIPPLRERPEDILPLARHLVAQLSKRLRIKGLRIDATSIDYLLAYPWPGNVRELANALERGAVLSADGVITPDCLPAHIVRDSTLLVSSSNQGSQTLQQMERKYIDLVLKSVGGNKTHAAKILDISPSTLWRKLRE